MSRKRSMRTIVYFNVVILWGLSTSSYSRPVYTDTENGNLDPEVAGCIYKYNNTKCEGTRTLEEVDFCDENGMLREATSRKGCSKGYSVAGPRIAIDCDQYCKKKYTPKHTGVCSQDHCSTNHLAGRCKCDLPQPLAPGDEEVELQEQSEYQSSPRPDADDMARE